VKRAGIPGGEPLLLVHLALGALLLVIVTATLADPDLWGHLRFGRDVVAAGAIPKSDVYSFTADRPWINHEWLAEVLMYAAYAKGRTPGLVAFKAGLALATIGVVLWSLRRFRPPPMTYDVVAVVTVVGILWRIQTLRPQVFSLFLFALLLLTLSEAARGRTRALLGVPPIMALWVNLHGGWLLGMSTLAIWLAVALIERHQGTRRRVILCGAGLGAALATLANPYGVQLWMFLLETVGQRRPDILEWASIPGIPLGAATPWIVSVAAAGFALLRSPLPYRPRDLAVIGVLAILAFRVNRLDGFLAIAVGVLLAPEFAQLWPARSTGAAPWLGTAPSPGAAPCLGTAPSRGAAPLPGPAPSSGARNRPGTPNRRAAIAVTLVAAVAMSLPVERMIARSLTCLELTPEWLPEPEATDLIRAGRLQGNVLTWFDWGEYIIWQFGPDLKVSIDGRRETLYSDELLASHYRFYRNESDAVGSLAVGFPESLHADYIWLPRRFPVVDALRQHGWETAFEGPVSILFSRRAGPRLAVADPRLSSPRCFPGP
jgi:hypothetical protein